MKKLLVLVLVLALSSLASAQIIFDISLSYSDGLVTITGLTTNIGTNAYGGIYVSAADDAYATVGDPLNSYAAAGDLRYISQYPPYNGVDIHVEKSSMGSISTGKWFEFGLTTSLSSVTFDLYEYEISYDVPLRQMTVATPEPATITLLCLGGLSLLKKRRA